MFDKSFDRFVEETETELEPLKPKANTRRLADVQRERVEWLWSGFLPKGKLVIIDGMPSMGKSTMTAEIAAIVSSNREFPCGTKSEPTGVLFLAVEDGDADTIRPRVEAAGGDLSRVYSLKGIITNGSEETPDLYRHMNLIREEVIKHEVGLVIIDPIMALMGDRIDSHRDQDVRKITTPLSALAEDLGVTILAVRHPNKSGSTNAIMRGGGSIGLIGAARVGLVIGKESEDSNDRILAVAKNNLAPNEESLRFRFVSDEQFGCARIEWLGTSKLSANELYVEPNLEDKSQTEEATEFLIGLLTTGECEGQLVKKKATEAGITEKPLRRAREKVAIVDRRGSGAQHGSWWSLKPEYLTHDPLNQVKSADLSQESNQLEIE